MSEYPQRHKIHHYTQTEKSQKQSNCLQLQNPQNLQNNGNFGLHSYPSSSSCSSSKVSPPSTATVTSSASRKRSIHSLYDQSNTEYQPNPTKQLKVSHPQLTGLDAYHKIGKLGEGTYGVVFLARDKRTDEKVALKKVKTGLSNEKKTGFPITSIREIKILQNLDHPNIVSLREVVRSTNIGYVFLVFEYYEHDLATLIDRRSWKPTLSEIKCILTQVLCAIEYAHKYFVIHRDIKFSNILLNNHGDIVLCDWGLSRLFSNPLQVHTPNVVTLWYRAPEILLGSDKYHTAIDIWAIGCILGELLLNKPLVQGMNEMEQIEGIYKLLGAPNHHIWPNYNQLPNILNQKFEKIQRLKGNFKYNEIDHLFGSGKFTANCLDLMKRLLAYDPSKRITATFALRHPFFDENPKAIAKDLMPTFPITIKQ